MRRFGFPEVDPLPSRTHIVHFYQHGKDLLKVFAGFCAAGLQDGDCCLWITAPPWTEGLALHELERMHADLKRRMPSGQLRFISSEDWYHAEDVLHVENTIANATQHFRDAQAQGWARVRVCGSPCLTGNDGEWLTCLQYEQHLHRMVTEMEALVLCAYRRGSLSDQIKDGLLQTHHMALERQGDGWWYRPTVS